MKFTLFKIQYLQLKKLASDIGSFYFILFLLVFFYFIAVLFKVYNNLIIARSAAFVVSSFILIINIERSDKEFVWKHIELPQLSLFTEYIIFSFLTIFPLLFPPSYFLFMFVLVAEFAFSYIKFGLIKKAFFPNLSNSLFFNKVEWLSGIRKMYLLLVVILLAAIFTSWIRIIPLIFLWLLTTVIVSFYQECEPLNILFATAKNSKSLIFLKIKEYAEVILVIYSPILLVNSLIVSDMKIVNILFLLVMIFLGIFAILLKYNTYLPKENQKGSSIILGLACCGSLVLYLLPIFVILCLRNYYKAVRNLKTYFND
jgi:hypothetical protein